jgi:prepilin-type N-terminal cleavage/methylation domain-containing protein
MRAFTLVELMVGLMVTSLLLSAVATLAFAMSHASTAGGDSALRQAQLRNATVRLSELIGNCKMICAAPGTDLAVWSGDTNNNGLVNVNELIYIERGADCKYLRLRRLYSGSNPSRTIAQLALTTTKTQLLNLCASSTISLIPDCNDAQFAFPDVTPPRTGLLAVSFSLLEDGAYQRHEIVTGLRCRAKYLLSVADEIITTGDDD